MITLSPYQRWRREPADKEAFGEWYTDIYSTLLEAGYRVSRGDRQAAEDLVQDAIVRFASRQVHQRVESESEATAYLMRSVYNGWIDSVRKHKKEVSASEGVEQYDLASPPEVLIAEDKVKEIEQSLKEVDLTILAMMIAGEPLSTIAELNKLSYPTAGVRVHRIRQLINNL